MKKVAIYVRVSTQEQAVEGYSISEQTDRLTKYCDAHGWIVVKVYTDPGYSGAKIDRPALQQMLRDIDQHLFDTVLVYKLDRLSRSQKDTMLLIEDVFLKNGIDFISMNENFDTGTPFGRAMIGILSVFAQLERDQIRERMTMGRIGRAKAGKYSGGPNAPIGYTYANDQLSIDEYEAIQIREAYDLLLNGDNGKILSLSSICARLSSKYTNKYSSWKHPSDLSVMLRSRLYIGDIKWDGVWYPGNHDPIISQEIFDAAQIELDRRTQTYSKSNREPFKGRHLLTGLVFCGYCGGRFGFRSVKGKRKKTNNYIEYTYYKCYSRSKSYPNMIKDPNCQSPALRASVLESTVIDEILKLQLDPDEIDRKAEASLPPENAKKKTLLNRIHEIDRQSAKLLDLYQIGSIDIDMIVKRMDSLKSERESLSSEIDKITAAVPLLSVDAAKDIISNASDVLNSGTPDEQQAFVRSLVSKVVICDGAVKIHWTFCV